MAAVSNSERLVYVPPLRRHRRLPDAIPDEIRPRREHFIRLLYMAMAGLPVMGVLVGGTAVLLEPLLGSGRDLPMPAIVLGGATAGYLAGRLQAAWLWEGTMPGRVWAPWSALGWALGAVLLAASGEWIEALGNTYGPHSGLLFMQIALLVSGAVAGGVSGAQQARVLRWRDLDSAWWVAASAGATALGWSIWLFADLSGRFGGC